MALTVEDVYEYVGVEPEYADDAQKRRAERALKASLMWIKGAVGERKDLEDPYSWVEWPLAEETCLMFAGELFETRTLVDTNLSKYAGSKATAALGRIAFDAINQLKYCAAPQEPPEGQEPPSDGESSGSEEEPGEGAEEGGEDEWQSETP